MYKISETRNLKISRRSRAARLTLFTHVLITAFCRIVTSEFMNRALSQRSKGSNSRGHPRKRQNRLISIYGIHYFISSGVPRPEPQDFSNERFAPQNFSNAIASEICTRPFSNPGATVGFESAVRSENSVYFRVSRHFLFSASMSN